MVRCLQVCCYNRVNVDWGIAWVNWQVEWHCREKGIEFSGHHHSLPAVMKALGTREVLEGMLKVAAQILNPFEIGARLQRRDVAPNKGCKFIICDGCIHFDG
jgi:hypothetical protein